MEKFILYNFELIFIDEPCTCTFWHTRIYHESEQWKVSFQAQYLPL